MAHPVSAFLPASTLFLVGPTAVGKSAVALQLAEALPAEIVSVDSMQVYRGMDVGTAKPSIAERQRVRHHLIDVVDPDRPFDAAQFVALAQAAAGEIERVGKTALFCGGTGLYVRALLEGLGSAPPADAGVRAELAARPLAELLAELAERDPETYARIDRQNPRRVVRALEIVRLTGRPASAQRAPWGSLPEPGGPRRPMIFGLQRSAADLRSRIERRVEGMFERGLVEETRAVLGRGLARNPTALQALGYRQVIEYLEGQGSLQETLRRVKARTWQYARRQMTWFRHQLPTTWVPVGPETTPAATARQVEALWRAAQRGGDVGTGSAGG